MNKVNLARLSCFAYLLISINCFSQIKIEWQEVVTETDGTVIVNVFAQNHGRGFELWNMPSNYSNKQNANFYIEYDLLRENRRVRILPQSVTIKTIFGSYIEMDSPTYFFNSTGATTGEHWQMIFQLPKNPSNTVIYVFGKKGKLTDHEGTIELKKKLEEEFLSKMDNPKFWYDYKTYQYEDWKKLEHKISIALMTLKRVRKKPVTGTITYYITPKGDTSIHLEIINPKFKESVTEAIGDFKLKKVSKYGWIVKSLAVFEFSVVKARYSRFHDVEVKGTF